MNKSGKLMAVFMSILILLGGVGCMQKQNKSISIDDMVSYMNEKYDDSFSYSSPYGGGAGATSQQIIVKSAKMPEYGVWVEYDMAQEKYSDNYVDYKYKKEIEKYLSEELSSIFSCESNVIRSISTGGSYAEYTNTTSFKEYINTSQQKIGFSAVLGTDAPVDKMLYEEKLSELFTRVEAGFFGSIYFVSSNENLDEFFLKDLSEQQQNKYASFSKLNNQDINFTWR